MNNLERLPDRRRGGTLRQKILLALLLSTGGVISAPKILSKFHINDQPVSAAGQVTTPYSPETTLSEEKITGYRTLEIVRGEDPILKDSRIVGFKFDPETLIDGVTQQAQQSGYLTFESGPWQGKVLLPTMMDQRMEQELLSEIHKISGNQTRLTMFVYEQRFQGRVIRLNGTAVIDPKKDVQIIQLSASPDVSIGMGELLVAVDNESRHIEFRKHPLYNNDQLQAFFKTYMADADNEVIAESKNPNSLLYGQDIAKLMDNGPQDLRKQLERTSRNALYQIFMERSYLGEGGHVWDSSEEFFTSAATVLGKFPDSFIKTTDRLAPQDQATVKDFARFVVEQSGVSMFDPKLIAYLQDSTN